MNKRCASAKIFAVSLVLAMLVSAFAFSPARIGCSADNQVTISGITLNPKFDVADLPTVEGRGSVNGSTPYSDGVYLYSTFFKDNYVVQKADAAVVYIQYSSTEGCYYVVSSDPFFIDPSVDPISQYHESYTLIIDATSAQYSKASGIREGYIASFNDTKTTVSFYSDEEPYDTEPEIPVDPMAYTYLDTTAFITKRIALGSTVTGFMNEMQFYGLSAIVNDKNGDMATDGVLMTGMTAEIGGGLSGSFKVVIKGDVNGDGAVDVTDAVYFKRDLLDIEKLTGAYLAAGDLDGSGTIDTTDYAYLSRYLRFIDNIYAEARLF